MVTRHYKLGYGNFGRRINGIIIDRINVNRLIIFIFLLGRLRDRGDPGITQDVIGTVLIENIKLLSLKAVYFFFVYGSYPCYIKSIKIFLQNKPLKIPLYWGCFTIKSMETYLKFNYVKIIF